MKHTNPFLQPRANGIWRDQFGKSSERVVYFSRLLNQTLSEPDFGFRRVTITYGHCYLVKLTNIQYFNLDGRPHTDRGKENLVHYVTAYREAIVDVGAKGIRLIYDAFEADHSGSERTQVSFKIVLLLRMSK